MRRKYDIRNKRNFIIILIISIIIVGIFSLFIYKYKQAGKVEYNIKTGCIVQDDKKNFIDVEEDAKLKVRWNGNYYLIYQDNKISLGKKVIVFDTISGSMKLYGKYHEIKEDGKIVENTKETTIANTTDTRFYKLDDREYLLIDREITSTDKSINASNYLLVELDRMGNAKLSNYKLNLKTINPTTLLTSKYSFDIANELLKYNKLDIDLKKIIGTSNQYKPEEKKEEQEGENGEGTNDGNGNGAGEGQGQGANAGTNAGTQTANGGTGDTPTVVDNIGEGGEGTTIEEIIERTKATSIIRISEGLTQLDIDYVVFDPHNEYKSVYATIVKNGRAENIPMSRVDTHMVIDGLKPDTEYKIRFYYTTVDKETQETITTMFEEVSMKTKKPVYNVSVYKISGINKTVSYKVYLQDGYPINKINVTLSFKYREIDEEDNVIIKDKELTKEIDVSNNTKVITDSFSIKGYDIVSNSIMKININSVTSTEGTININSYTTFRIGG